jgi:Tol biopolymer transport system component
MTLAPGVRRGSYEIVASLGVGGMGEVWRARDLRLRRDVAIKALPESVAADPERLARLEREARLLAALNHPNIAAIYGLEETGGSPLLVMECVEGESLAQRLAAGPLPVDDALSIAVQVAAGIEAAHGAGVIHRDLKPANVMIRPDGSVKVLDLGLARTVESATTTTDPSMSPTITSAPTGTGVILGTAAYMSPEQARGKTLDKRTDIFSFGCVLYECLTAKRAFPGETVSDTLAAILRAEPDWKALPAETTPRVRDLLRRCLQKDPKRRLHDIADGRIEIEEAITNPEAALPVEFPVRASTLPRRSRFLWAAGGLLAGTAVGVLAARGLLRSPDRNVLPSIRSSLSLPPETRIDTSGRHPSMALSPDGTSLVFRAVSGGVPRLYLRSVDRADASPIPGTERAFNPFFSPDGEWLAFFTSSELKKVPLAGGTPLTVAVVPPVSRGGTWASDGFIYFSPIPEGGLFRVAAAGGVPETFTTPDAKEGEGAHVWPQALPDGEHLLLIVRSEKNLQDLEGSNVAVHSLKTGRRRIVLQGASFARYVPPDRLLFVRGRSVQAVSVDPKRWELTGKPVPLLRDVLIAASDATAYFAVGGNGLLVYAAGGLAERETSTLVWVDRNGSEESLPLPARTYFTPRLSPDGRILAVAIAERSRISVWTYDFARKALSPLVPERGGTFNPTWAPDGLRIAFSRLETEWPRLFWRVPDGSALEALTSGGQADFPTSFSPDGRLLAYASAAPGKLENSDIRLLSLDERREQRPWLATPFDEFAPFFSPEGRWIAYVSSESGRREVYVRPFAGPGGRVRISTEGGGEPAWSPDGKELFYRIGDRLMGVRVKTSPAFTAATPRVLLTGSYVAGGGLDVPRLYDVSPDGRRFLFIKPVQKKEEPITRLELVVNWPTALARATTGGR